MTSHRTRMRPTWLVLLGMAVILMACSGGESSSASSGNDGGDGSASSTAAPARSWAGEDPSPDFPGGLTWFNVDRPLTIPALKGKIVLLDFWTLGCINCQHIIPDLKRLEAEFGDALVVVGVHSGKYSTEHEDDSISEAIDRYGLDHPVVNDPDFAVWRTFGANAWPTLVLIDPAGNLVGMHAGEGVYPLFQPILDSLVREFEAMGVIDRTPIALNLAAKSASTILSYPSKVLADERGGRLFIADAGHNRIVVTGLDGRAQLVVGTGEEGFADGAANEATFRQPQGLALSEDGTTLYVADTRNHAVRAVSLPSGEVRTIAGTGKQLDRLPDPAAQPRQTALASPWDVLVDGQTLYVAMAGVHQLWSIDLGRNVLTVFTGTSREGIQDGDRTQTATLAQPSGLASDETFLYWVDPESSSLRRVALDGNGPVETLVGTGLFDYGDRDGRGASGGQLQHAQGVAVANGRVYIGDTYNHKVREYDPATRELTTLAGSGARGWSDGQREEARFDEPGGLSFAAGRLFLADTNNHLVRIVDPASGMASTLRLTGVSGATEESDRVQLPSQEASPGGSTLRLTFRAPAGHKLNSQAPSRVTLKADNGQVVDLGERELTWSTDETSVSLPVPVVLSPGSATITATVSVYFCREGEEALCFIRQAELSLPVVVRDGATAGELLLEYVLPVSPA